MQIGRCRLFLQLYLQLEGTVIYLQFCRYFYTVAVLLLAFRMPDAVVHTASRM